MINHLVQVVIALGSNLGNRERNLRSAVRHLGACVNLVRLSGVWETDPVDCPPDSSPFLNMVVAGATSCEPGPLLEMFHGVEQAFGRRRRLRNEPRLIDVDLILYGAYLSRQKGLCVPHERFATRNFVLEPFRELELDWTVAGRRINQLRGKGAVRRVGNLY